MPSFGPDRLAEAPSGDASRGFAVYVHWPFCLAKCPYCDFNSHVRDTVDQRVWREALLAEIDHYAGETGPRRTDSVFFGGGTPSLMPPETVAAILERINARWPLAADAEVTLEANPTSVEAGNFRALADAGVNRLSLGIQALDDAALRALGRHHSAAEAIAAIELARRNFQRLSFDLIYARPDQKVADWRAELARAIGLAVDHLSLYQLTIEPGTAFATEHRLGRLVLPEEDAAVALWETTQEVCAATGMPAYEISNHAVPGAECRHNLTYWRYGEYVGIGAGAHGRPVIGGARLATMQERLPEKWLAAVRRQGHATVERSALDAQTRAEEMLMMGLRLGEGIRRADFVTETGLPLESFIDAAGLERLSEAGLVELTPERLSATKTGLPLLNSLLATLLP